MTIRFEGRRITASKEMLNYISILAMEAADKFEKEGADALANEARELSNLIYEELSKSGLYD